MNLDEQLRPKDHVSLGAVKSLAEQVKMQWHWEAIMERGDGTIERQTGPNQVQTLGKQHIADALSDQGETAMGWMAIGTGTGQGVGDNTLATELDRQALDSGTPSHSGAVVTYSRTFAAGEGTGTVTEAGVFNDAAAGDMLIYTGAISFAKGAADALTINWTLTIS